MHRNRWIPLFIAAALLAMPVVAFAQAEDDPHAEYSRKTIVHFNTWFAPDATDDLRPDQAQYIAATMRDAVELKRFDVIKNFPGDNAWDIEEFARNFRDFYDANAEEIAAARADRTGEGYKWEYRGQVLTLDMIERVLDSAYLYQGIVESYNLVYHEDPIDDREANGWTWVRHYWTGRLVARLQFYKINMTGEPVITRLPDKVIQLGGTGERVLPPKNIVVENPDNPWTRENWDALDQSERDALQADAIETVFEECAGRMGYNISNGVRNLFPITAQIDERIGTAVTIPFGRAEDVYNHEGFFVYEVTEGGGKRIKGYTRVQHVGAGQVSSERGQSQAEQDRSSMLLLNGDGVVGDMVEEHPWAGLDIGLFGGVGIFSSDAVAGGGTTLDKGEVIFGGNLEIKFDIGRFFNDVPEIWIGIVGGIYGGSGGMKITFDIEFEVGVKIYNVGGVIGLGINPAIGIGYQRFEWQSTGDINLITLARGGGNNVAAGQNSVFKEQIYVKIGVTVSYFLLLGRLPAEVFLQIDARVLFDNSDIVKNGGDEVYLPGLNPALIVPVFQIGFRIFF